MSIWLSLSLILHHPGGHHFFEKYFNGDINTRNANVTKEIIYLISINSLCLRGFGEGLILVERELQSNRTRVLVLQRQQSFRAQWKYFSSRILGNSLSQDRQLHVIFSNINFHSFKLCSTFYEYYFKYLKYQGTRDKNLPLGVEFRSVNTINKQRNCLDLLIRLN